MLDHQPQDDPSILDDDELWRRVPPYQLVTESDGNITSVFGSV